MKLIILCLLFLAVLGRPNNDDLKITIDMVQNYHDDDYCDIEVVVDSQRYPAGRGQHGAVGCWSTLEHLDDWDTRTWAKYHGWILYGEVPTHESRWNETEYTDMDPKNSGFVHSVLYYDDDEGAWAYKVDHKMESRNQELHYSFYDDVQFAVAEWHKENINPLMKNGEENPYTCYFQKYDIYPRLKLPKYIGEWTDKIEEIDFDSESCDIHEHWNKPDVMYIPKDKLYICYESSSAYEYLLGTCGVVVAGALLM